MYREIPEHPLTETKHPCLTLWRSRIDWAEQNGGFHRDHVDLAARWHMCAVGEAHRLYGIPYRPSREIPSMTVPVDDRLRQYGNDFYDAVWAGDVSRARNLLAAIEQRLAELV